MHIASKSERRNFNSLGQPKVGWRRWSFRNGSLWLALGLILMCALPGQTLAQNVQFLGVQSTLATGLNEPVGVAKDKEGDLFVANYDPPYLVKVPAGGGSPTPVSLPDYGPFVTAVAIDGNDNLYVGTSNETSGWVFKMPAQGGTATMIGSGFSYPTGIAVDSSGDVFVADGGKQKVYEVPKGGGQLTLNFSIVKDVGNVAVDGNGNVFVSDFDAKQIAELPAGSSTPISKSVADYSFAVAVDTAGNLFVALANETTESDGQVVELPAGGGTPITLSSAGLKYPEGITIDSSGNLFLADTGNDRLIEIETRSVNFAASNVCPPGQSTPAPCSETLSLNYAVPSGGDISIGSTLTQGAPNLDFTLATGSTCIGHFDAGGTCIVNVTFTPKYAGLREGAVQITGDLGNVLATTNIYGTGIGPQIAFSANKQNTVGNGFSYPTAVATDGAGDTYIVDNSNYVYKIPAGGGPQTTVGTGLSSPYGVAVDGIGNVYIADAANQRVVEVPAGGGQQTTVGSRLQFPVGVAVDGAGDIFILDLGWSSVFEVPASGGPQISIGTGLLDPQGIAVDAAGNVFISDTANNRVVEVPADGSAQTTVVSSISGPSGIAVDAADNLYIATGNSILEVLVGSGTSTTVGTGLSAPAGVFVDGAGNVFIADYGHARVVEVPRAQAPALNFASTDVGKTSTDSAQLVGVENIGNQPLSLTKVSYPADFPESSSLGSGETACQGNSSLAVGGACYLAVNFSPLHAGALSETLTLTDNSLNAVSATQSIALSGTGIGANTPAALTAPTSSVLPGPSATFTWSSQTGAAGYWLFIGTTGVGSKDLYDSGETTATSITYGALPLTGATIYVRLYTSYSGTLVHNDYKFTAARSAVLTSPAPSGTLPGPSATFTWSSATGTGVQGYWLFLGTSGAGSKNLYDSGEITGTSVTVSSLPLTGATIYARVYTSYNGTLKYNDYTYAAAKLAVLTSPAPGGTLPGPSATFTWSAATGTGVQGYWLFLGTSGKGSKNLYDSGEITGTSVTVSGLPLTGGTIYARVYTSYSGTLEYNDYTFTSAQQAKLTMPAPGSTLQGSSATFDWSAATGSGAQGYWLFLGTTGAGSKNLYDSGQTTATSVKVSGLPTNAGATIYARLYTSYGGKLEYLDYIYMEQ